MDGISEVSKLAAEQPQWIQDFQVGDVHQQTLYVTRNLLPTQAGANQYILSINRHSLSTKLPRTGVSSIQLCSHRQFLHASIALNEAVSQSSLASHCAEKPNPQLWWVGLLSQCNILSPVI